MSGRANASFLRTHTTHASECASCDVLSACYLLRSHPFLTRIVRHACVPSINDLRLPTRKNTSILDLIFSVHSEYIRGSRYLVMQRSYVQPKVLIYNLDQCWRLTTLVDCIQAIFSWLNKGLFRSSFISPIFVLETIGVVLMSIANIVITAHKFLSVCVCVFELGVWKAAVGWIT